MRIERTKNATRNIAVGFLLKTYQLLAPFLIRTIIIKVLGMEYLGLNSLFTSILQVLNLAELGVGSAMVYSMYKPIAEDDYDTISDLMRLYQLYYHIIGLVILLVGIVISPFVPKLINGELPNGLNIYILYYLNLITTVISYWLFAYKNCLLTAHQRNDIVSKVTISTSTVMYIGQAIMLILFKNYYLYLIISLLGQISLNICTAMAADKMFPNYKPSRNINKTLSKDINQRIKDLFTSKVGEIIVNSADSLVISAFLGLTVLASYNSYFYILSAIFGFVILFLQACTAGIGNSLIVETTEKNFNDLRKMTFLVSWIAGFCSCCLMCLYQPFMELWIGEKNLLSIGCVICFVVYFYFRCINQLFVVYKDAAGMWHEDRFRPLVTALTNLGLNLITVRYLGLYGVLLSTVISTLLIGMPWILYNISNTIVHCSIKIVVVNLIFYTLVNIISVSLIYYICEALPLHGVLEIIIRLCICCVVSNLIYIFAYMRTKEFKDTVMLMDKMIGLKVSIFHRLFLKLR